MSITTERSAIIVGPGRTFGRALVQRFLSEGFHVGIVGKRLLSEGAFGAIRAALPPDAPIATAMGDAARAGSLSGALGSVVRLLPPLAVLIYNACEPVPSGESPGWRDDVRRHLSVGVGGVYEAFEWATRFLSKNGESLPTVIFTGSASKDAPDPKPFAPVFSKRAQHLLWDALQPEAARAGIHLATVVIHGAVGIPPGPTPEAVAEAFWLAATDRSRTQWAV